METNVAKHLDKNALIEDIFIVLNSKEREVITRRYAIGQDKNETLEKIGQTFSVTRERVRQIENGALKKLRRTINNTKLRTVVKFAKEILNSVDGVILEQTLVNKILSESKEFELDENLIRLSLSIDKDIIIVKKSAANHVAWHDSQKINLKTIKDIGTQTIKILEKKKDCTDVNTLVADVEAKLKGKATAKQIQSALEIFVDLKETEEGVGLTKWRHINPKSIRDKALIVMRNSGKPIHFIEIANVISKSGFDGKSVTTQAVHNELIRDESFVLVGRGLYALREWGYADGTVEDVIKDILLKAGKPLTKTEICKEVLLRRDVKIGTIALNLQKNPHFVRVGRAVYEYKEEL
jgi:hypothetical protein